MDEPDWPREGERLRRTSVLVPEFTQEEAARHSQAIFEQDLPSMLQRGPKLPWETGIMATIFGNGDPLGLPSLPVVAAAEISDMLAPTRPEEEQEEDPLPMPSNLPVYSKHIKALTDRDYDAATALLWTRALSRWLAIIQSSSYESSVGKHVDALLEKKDRDSAMQCIRDACGVRSPRTVLKRAQDLESFIRYRGEDGWWPLDETDLINYLEWCQKKDKSKLTGKNLKHSVKFFRHVMGAHFDEEEVLGPVFTGRASRIGATKEVRSQARALTVEEVLKLEEVVVRGRNTLDRYFAGCLLFCLYSRARWSDIGNVDRIEWDVTEVEGEPFGFIETRTRITKTSTTEEKKILWMPFVAPIVGLGPQPWGLAWAEVLKELRFNLDHSPYGPICRAPCADGSFSKRSVSTPEASGLLADFLKVKDEKMHSHSLKTTTLVWAARFGLSDRSRAILGHHSIKDQSMACYSRDLLTGPTRELCAMLLNIKTGRFKPDSTRSGWLAPKLDRLHIPQGSKTPKKPGGVAPQTPWFRPADMGDVFGEQEIFGDLSDLPPGDGKDDDLVIPPFWEEIPAAQPSNQSQPEGEEGEVGREVEPEKDEDIENLKVFMAGRWPGSEEEDQAAADFNFELIDEATGDEFVDTASSEDDDIEDCSDSEAEEDFYNSQNVRTEDIPMAVPGDLIQNNKSKMLHKASDDKWKTLCGLTVGNSTHLPHGSRFKWPLCSRCFKESNDSKDGGLVGALDAAKRRRLAP